MDARDDKKIVSRLGSRFMPFMFLIFINLFVSVDQKIVSWPFKPLKSTPWSLSAMENQRGTWKTNSLVGMIVLCLLRDTKKLPRLDN